MLSGISITEGMQRAIRENKVALAWAPSAYHEERVCCRLSGLDMTFEKHECPGEFLKRLYELLRKDLNKDSDVSVIYINDSLDFDGVNYMFVIPKGSTIKICHDCYFKGVHDYEIASENSDACISLIDDFAGILIDEYRKTLNEEQRAKFDLDRKI